MSSVTEIRLIENEDGTWSARHLDVGISAQGDTRSEALSALDDVVAAVRGEGGRPPTDEELRAVGINPADNATAGNLPTVLKN